MYEVLGIIICVGALGFVFSIIFYDNMAYALFLMPGIIPAIKRYRRNAVIKRKEKLLKEFRYALDFITTGLMAGLSVEKAFEESNHNLKEMFGDKSYICKEISLIINKVSLGESVESGVIQFAHRTHIREINDFAGMFEVSKRTGADMARIIKNTSGIIMEKILLKEEVLTITTSKRFEAKVMKAMPMVIIAYLRWGADNYFESLYHNVFGVLIMTGTIISYALASFWLDKISSLNEWEE